MLKANSIHSHGWKLNLKKGSVQITARFLAQAIGWMVVLFPVMKKIEMSRPGAGKILTTYQSMLGLRCLLDIYGEIRKGSRALRVLGRGQGQTHKSTTHRSYLLLTMPAVTYGVSWERERESTEPRVLKCFQGWNGRGGTRKIHKEKVHEVGEVTREWRMDAQWRDRPSQEAEAISATDAREPSKKGPHWAWPWGGNEEASIYQGLFGAGSRNSGRQGDCQVPSALVMWQIQWGISAHKMLGSDLPERGAEQAESLQGRLPGRWVKGTKWREPGS